MFETVRIVKGYRVYRMTGTKSIYHVDLKVLEHSKMRMTFKTIKSAVEYIENNL